MKLISHRLLLKAGLTILIAVPCVAALVRCSKFDAPAIYTPSWEAATGYNKLQATLSITH